MVLATHEIVCLGIDVLVMMLLLYVWLEMRKPQPVFVGTTRFYNWAQLGLGVIFKLMWYLYLATSKQYPVLYDIFFVTLFANLFLGLLTNLYFLGQVREIVQVSIDQVKRVKLVIVVSWIATCFPQLLVLVNDLAGKRWCDLGSIVFGGIVCIYMSSQTMLLTWRLIKLSDELKQLVNSVSPSQEAAASVRSLLLRIMCSVTADMLAFGLYLGKYLVSDPNLSEVFYDLAVSLVACHPFFFLVTFYQMKVVTARHLEISRVVSESDTKYKSASRVLDATARKSVLLEVQPVHYKSISGVVASDEN